VGSDLGVPSASSASAQLFEAVPFYAGLSLEEIGGRGIRWQERPAANAYPQTDVATGDQLPAQLQPSPPDAAELAAYRSVWDATEVEFSPALEFLHPRSAKAARAKAVLPLSHVGGDRT
jgi:NADH-quinone oxidoreductase subunit G